MHSSEGMNQVETIQTPVELEVFGRSDVGRVYAHNEDAFVVADLTRPEPVDAMPGPIGLQVGARGLLLAVSDGVGGANAGEVASALTLRVLRDALATVTAVGPGEALVAAVETANTVVFRAAGAAAHSGMCATLVAVLLHGNEAFVAEVGDSRAYLLRGDELVQLTRDQSCAQLLLEAGALTPESASEFNSNVILQAMGHSEAVEVALHRVALHHGDRILLCSDGLTREISDDQIQTAITIAPTLDRACSDLIDAANAAGGNDNITAVLAVVQGDALPRRTAVDHVAVEDVRAYQGSSTETSAPAGHFAAAGQEGAPS